MNNYDRMILIVEDSLEDYECLIQTFKKWKVDNHIIYCETGDDALDFLYRQGKYSGYAAGVRPCMILLDLNLPGTDGREVLEEIKEDEKLNNIPVIIMTSSEDERDVKICYRAGVHAYLRKPLDPQELITTINRVQGL